MKALEELKQNLMEELEEIARKPEMGAGDLEIVHRLTSTIKNLDEICMLEDGEYDEGYSYARHRDSRGRYSRDGEVRTTHPYRGTRYSRDGGRDMLIARLEEMMDDASTEKERAAIHRCMDSLRSA